LDHILILSEEHLRRTLAEYVRYPNEAGRIRGYGQMIPTEVGTWKVALSAGKVVAAPVFGGLHYDDRRAA